MKIKYNGQKADIKESSNNKKKKKKFKILPQQQQCQSINYKRMKSLVNILLLMVVHMDSCSPFIIR